MLPVFDLFRGSAWQAAHSLQRYMGARSRAACLLHALTWGSFLVRRPSLLMTKLVGD